MSARPEPTEDDVHVMPTYGREHESSVDCWCVPKHSYTAPETGAHLWVHKAPRGLQLMRRFWVCPVSLLHLCGGLEEVVVSDADDMCDYCGLPSVECGDYGCTVMGREPEKGPRSQR